MAPKDDGFSIIELMVVIAIIAILIAIAAMSGSAWLKKYDVESQTKTMYIDILNARASAIQRNRMYFVKLENTRYTVYADTNPGPDGDGVLQTTQDTEVMHKDIKPVYGISWNGTGTIAFSPSGLISGSTTSTVWVPNSFSSAYNCITVETTRIKIGGSNGTSNCVAQ